MFNQSYKKSDVYPGHLAMTYGDAEKMGRLNARNEWGITYDELRELGKKHAAARKKDDIRAMEKNRVSPGRHQLPQRVWPFEPWRI